MSQTRFYPLAVGMPAGPAWRRLLWPGLMTLAMLAVLIGLGTWQLRRLAWKNAFLARIAAAEQAPAVALPAQPSPFQKVRVSGHLGTSGTQSVIVVSSVHPIPTPADPFL